MINFGCPTCGGQMSVPANMAGGTANCPKCGTLIQVPAAAAQPPAPQQIIVQGQSQRVIVNRGWGCLSLIGLVVVVCAIVPIMCTAGTCITCAGLGSRLAPDIDVKPAASREERRKKRPATSPARDTAAEVKPAPQRPATQPSPPPPKPAEIPHPHADAIAAVKQTFRAGQRYERIRTAPFRGGVAVLVDKDAAYWVGDGKVHAANSTASIWSPGLPWSPTGIHLISIQKAIRAQLAKVVPPRPTTRAIATTRPATPKPPSPKPKDPLAKIRAALSSVRPYVTESADPAVGAVWYWPSVEIVLGKGTAARVVVQPYVGVMRDGSIVSRLAITRQGQGSNYLQMNQLLAMVDKKPVSVTFEHFGNVDMKIGLGGISESIDLVDETILQAVAGGKDVYLSAMGKSTRNSYKLTKAQIQAFRAVHQLLGLFRQAKSLGVKKLGLTMEP